ncbi:MAG: 4-(cytidine 5'-diphospho)-2-C-methyl-D-erythritol kinase [Acidobacteriota bacterium]|nr:4-(cytidine 5'-diphospho)-2-C-methyl-D-erythritol kinase [Acidobacteriota bacterium]
MSETSFTLPSFAKINWYLRVLGKRDDGFHELRTIFQTVSLHDNLTFNASDEIGFDCDNQTIPTDETNLVVKAAKILREKYAVKTGAAIRLEKRIPAPGGLGGGSSNAAVTLIGLAKLWSLKITLAEITEIGGKIGADVPFFFCGGTALGTGRGSEITPVKDAAEKFLLIVTPPVSVSTGEAFARLNVPRLTKIDSKSILNVCRNDAESLDFRQANLKNDFEPSVFAVQPEIRRVKEKLLELGAIQARLSGSGASVYAIFENEETRQMTLKALDVEINWRKFAVATVSRQKYRESLGITDKFQEK